MVLTLMCGLSFSGKSTLSRQLAARLGAEVISLDAINLERGLDGGQGIPVEEWAATNRMAETRVRDLLLQRRHVIVDDTASPRFIRDGWRAIAEKAGSGFILVWVQIDETLLQRRLRANRVIRSRPDVIDDVLDTHIRGFEAPAHEEPLIVHATATRDAQQVDDLARAIRAAEVEVEVEV